jgi:hypothetical protein
MTADKSQAWPVLTLADWEETRDTLHMWTQVIGKIRLELEPMVNHWWQVVLYVSARGLTTSLMHAGNIGLEIEFDFLEDVLVVRTTNGETRTVALTPRTVADFYGATLDAVSEVGVDVSIFTRPVEIVDAIPFQDDVTHCAYDADAVRRFWRALLATHRVMTEFRGRFIGKASPVHFFWGAADLAVSRFSGRRAPVHGGGVPNCADWVQELAYSHEVSSCGFWPGGTGEGFFYSYVYPEPDGFAHATIEPGSASYDSQLGEFVLPYTDVRTASNPDALLLSFFQTTYEAAADLGHWPRAELES